MDLNIDQSNSQLAYQVYKVSLEKFGHQEEPLSQVELDEVYRIAKRKLKIEQAVLASPEAANLVVLQSQVDDVYNSMVDNCENEEDFSRDMENIGLDESGLKELLMRELKVESVLDYVSINCQAVSEEDISLFYHMNASKFQQPEIRTTRHILVTVNEDNEENTKTKSHQKITQIRQRLLKKPDRFEEQALKHSECPTALEGGLLGQVKPGVLYPELESVVYELQLGELSEVIESPLGYHLLRCDEIESAGLVPFDRVKTKLGEYLIERKQKLAQREWLSKILSNDDAVEKSDGELTNA